MRSQNFVLLGFLCFLKASIQYLIAQEQEFGVPTLILDTLQLTLSSKLLLDVHSPKGTTLRGYLGWLPLDSNFTYTSCKGIDSPAGSICLEYSRDMKFSISPDNEEECNDDGTICFNVPCYKIHWKKHVSGVMDCLLLEDDLWYGGGEVLTQKWPLQNESRDWYASVTGDPIHHKSGSVVENLWLSSRGFAIYVDGNTPLFVSFNDSGSNKLCFTTSNSRHPFNYVDSKDLIYSICAARSIKEAYTFSAKKWLERPRDIPDPLVFKYPIWSTWARYKKDINHKRVLEYANEIIKMDFPHSQFEIDDNWEMCYGSLAFNDTKFPNPKELVKNLKSMGFRITLWVHPFCNVDCYTYQEGKDKGYWVNDINGNSATVHWWNGVAAMLDVTNKDARVWFVSRLEKLKKNYGIDSFKFDAGEISWLDSPFAFHDGSVNLQPNIYSKLYAEMASRFGGMVEVRSAFQSQNLPVFLRMFDKFSSWNENNGLKTLIPTALQLSTMGYHFILPDMVGGNNYDSPDGSIPDKELYIRWLEANVFLPSIQFSIPPWDYDNETIEISRKMLDLRNKYSNLILSLAKESIVTAEPIVRPLWFLDSDDIESLTIDSEFLVGDVLLVAPILEKNHRQRDIYFPEGRWSDVQRSYTYEGPQWLYEYKAPLGYLPYFLKQA